jgi:hypothetical protein
VGRRRPRAVGDDARGGYRRLGGGGMACVAVVPCPHRGRVRRALGIGGIVGGAGAAAVAADARHIAGRGRGRGGGRGGGGICGIRGAASHRARCAVDVGVGCPARGRRAGGRAGWAVAALSSGGGHRPVLPGLPVAGVYSRLQRAGAARAWLCGCPGGHGAALGRRDGARGCALQWHPDAVDGVVRRLLAGGAARFGGLCDPAAATAGRSCGGGGESAALRGVVSCSGAKRAPASLVARGNRAGALRRGSGLSGVGGGAAGEGRGRATTPGMAEWGASPVLAWDRVGGACVSAHRVRARMGLALWRANGGAPTPRAVRGSGSAGVDAVICSCGGATALASGDGARRRHHRVSRMAGYARRAGADTAGGGGAPGAFRGGISGAGGRVQRR